MEQDTEVKVEVDIQVYYTGRDMPVSTPMMVIFNAEELPKTIEEITDTATAILYEKLDSRSCHILIIEDRFHNKRIIPRDNFENLVVMAPDPERLPEELNGLPLH